MKDSIQNMYELLKQQWPQNARMRRRKWNQGNIGSCPDNPNHRMGMKLNGPYFGDKLSNENSIGLSCEKCVKQAAKNNTTCQPRMIYQDQHIPADTKKYLKELLDLSEVEMLRLARFHMTGQIQ